VNARIVNLNRLQSLSKSSPFHHSSLNNLRISQSAFETVVLGITLPHDS
jgi:hypothetical protein